MISKSPPSRAKSAGKPTPLTHQINFLRLANVNIPAMPIVTAAAWAINDAKTGDLLWEKKGEDQKEMASLTKMMTFHLCMHLLEKYKESEDTVFTVNKISAVINGTHSGLREGDQITILDLFYGLMLPSGNDCALSLAYGFGNWIMKKKKKKYVDDGAPISPVKEFVKEMNKFAKKIGLRNTHYSNPHGLSEKGNKSTAADLGRLAYMTLQSKLSQKIVSTKEYTAFVMDIRGNKRTLFWQNTNKLLEKGFCGIKTGVTPNAGPCLSSMLKDQNDESVIVTLLNCKSMEHRWTEAEKLAQWALSSINWFKDQFENIGPGGSPKKFNTRIIAGLCKQP